MKFIALSPNITDLWRGRRMSPGRGERGMETEWREEREGKMGEGRKGVGKKR